MNFNETLQSLNTSNIHEIAYEQSGVYEYISKYVLYFYL